MALFVLHSVACHCVNEGRMRDGWKAACAGADENASGMIIKGIPKRNKLVGEALHNIANARLRRFWGVEHAFLWLPLLIWLGRNWRSQCQVFD